ncbi:baseplate J/gp47 family protein [Serratia marcescens]|uniref:baseplate J/gp47 family protein n=1 Tax=Serratia marcescens TaxID=615 RepID=UPI00146E35A6|nr:baseplate J/gp47 family protein [Serratia marcescens]NMT24662.1 baseplate J/gp47 family protein [Serratia marcescens]
MPFNVPTLRQLIKTGEQDIEIELDEKLPPVGVERALNTSFSGAVRDVYDFQSWIADQVVPSPKSDDQTIIDTASTEGVIRKAATYATGKAVFKGSQPIPLNTEMQARNGNGYHVITASAPANGVQTVTIQADDVGASGNLDADAQLTLVSPIPGVESTGVVDGNGLTGGTDIEPISELLDRLLFRKRNPPVGGAVHDYVIWAREMAGVSRAWAWDAWHGPGTVGLAWVYDSRTDITPTAADRAAMNEYLFRHADPATGNFVGKPGGIEVWIISLTLKPIGPAIKLVPDSAETRRATLANLNALQRTLSPGSTLLLSSLRTAIGTATGVTDYTLNINSDITSASGELITIGDVTWLTA